MNEGKKKELRSSLKYDIKITQANSKAITTVK